MCYIYLILSTYASLYIVFIFLNFKTFVCHCACKLSLGRISLLDDIKHTEEMCLTIFLSDFIVSQLHFCSPMMGRNKDKLLDNREHCLLSCQQCSNPG